MRIVRAELEELALRLRRPLVTSRGTIAVRRGMLLRLVADDGVEGVGEASPAYWLGETSLARTVADLRVVLALVTTRPDAARLRALALSPGAACAVDTALLDLEARQRCVAVASLLASRPPMTVAVSALLTGETPEELAREAEAAVAEGFRTLKIKLGTASVAEDVRKVETVRARVGDAVALRLDANRGWRLAVARDALAALAPIGVEFIEEPLRAAESSAFAALASSTRVPLALDESVRDQAQLARIVETGAAPVIVLKAARLAGPTRVLALARAAATYGIRTVVSDSLESVVGMSVAVHLAAVSPPPRSAVGLGGARLLAPSRAGTRHPRATPFLTPIGPGFDVAPSVEAASGGVDA